jgi:uncharacterized protein (TIGR03000 family)
MKRINPELCRAALALAMLAVSFLPMGAQSVPGSAGATSSAAYYPYWGEAPSSYGGALLPYQGVMAPVRPYSSPLSSPTLFGSASALDGRRSGVSAASTFLSSDANLLRPGGDYSPRQDSRAHIWLRLPADAEVLFDGAKTKQEGTLRYYYSPPLAAGQKYAYEIRVRWSKDGKSVERKRQVDVRAGDTVRLEVATELTPKDPAPPRGK